MLTVSQPVERAIHAEGITVQVRAEEFTFSTILVLPKHQTIQGACVSLECVPPGLRLHLRRNQFFVRGTAIHRGTWAGTLYIHVEGQLVKKQLIFVAC